MLTCPVCRLVLEWNALGVWDEAFSLFCGGLASNTALTQLDLRNNQINHHGASQLALALMRNNSLEGIGDAPSIIEKDTLLKVKKKNA